MSAGGSIGTGSGLERAMECRGSTVLPKVYDDGNEFSEAGNEQHAYLQRISDGQTPEESLAQAPEELRDACEGLDLGGMDIANLSAEVTIVVHLPTGAARILGQGLNRDYRGVADDEIAGTIDLAGVDIQARRGRVDDHKTGWSRRTAARDNWQIKIAAYGLHAIYDLDDVDGALRLFRPGKPRRDDCATFDVADFLVIRAELRQLHRRVIADRAAHAAGQPVPVTEGGWCKYCPSYWHCPAKTEAVRAALAITDDHPITVADVGATLDKLEAARKAIKTLESKIYAMAAVQPMLLDYDPETGTETWLGGHTKLGNEVLDGPIGIDITTEVLQVPPEERAAFARELAPPETVAKKAIKAAVQKRAKALGKKIGATEEEILDKIRAAGGAKKPPKHDVGVYTVLRASAADEAA